MIDKTPEKSHQIQNFFPRINAFFLLSYTSISETICLHFNELREWLSTLSVFLKLLMVPCQEQLEKLKQNSLAKEPILVLLEDSSSLPSLSYAWESLV